MKRALVIAPHPDDEILGVGGTIAKLVKNQWEVFIVIVTKGLPPLFTEKLVEQSRTEARKSHDYLGIKETIFFDAFPAAQLDQVSHSELNNALSSVINRIKPQLVFLPFIGDIHLDHQIVFMSSLVASRPFENYTPKKILAYETLSETFWNSPYLSPMFSPNVFIDISEQLEMKLEAMKIYNSQIKKYPQQRSLQAIKALAELRGSTINVAAAESFVLIREIIY